VAALLVLLSACGGIEGTGSPLAAIEGTGLSAGGVSGFGSVFVNGVEYSTDTADIVINGVPMSESDLSVGMVVSVVGEVAADGLRGVARRVEFDRPLAGAIDAVDREARVITVLGQTVRLDDATLFGDASEETLAADQFCEISGYPTGPASLLASLVTCGGEYVAGQTLVEAEGLASDIDAAGNRFSIGGLVVNAATATWDYTGGTLAEGALVEVIGRQPQRGGELQATRVRIKSPALAPAQRVELEGVVSRFNGLADFSLNRQRIDASSAQRMDDHALAPANDVRMRVQGVVGADGVIAATRYAVQPATDILMTARVDAVDRDRDQLTLLGKEGTVLQFTQYEDRRPSGLRRFRLRDVEAGDYVQARGFRRADGRTLITRIERRTEEEPTSGTVVARFRVGLGSPDPTLTKVRGPLDAADTVQGTLVISSVMVRTDNTRTEFFDRNGASVTSLQFFNAVRPGDRLEAEGNESNDVVDATRVRYVP
jgi:hypothetical protein